MSQSDIAISVRNLSKSYTISHQANGLRGRRPTFRDTVTNFVTDPFKRTPKETFWALKDVSFDVKKGDVVGIIGRNGAGKSTLLKILSRITKPTSGEIDVYGRIGSLLEVGTGFHPELTGRENIFLNGAILGMTRPEIRTQFDAIVDFAEVEKFLDTPVKRYSSGMYVRLAFAVAAHLNPEILVVDEVLAVGDAEFQRKCLGKMSDIAKAGRTVIFVSHNMPAIRSLCSRGLLLKAGEVFCDCGASEAAEAYNQNIGGYGNTIVSFVTKCHKDVRLDAVRVNGHETRDIHVPSEVTEVQVEIEGSISRPLRMDLELWLMDTSDTVLGFYGRGHEEGTTLPMPRGRFSLARTIQLPKTVNRGDYVLSLALTDHNVEGWADLPRSVRLIVEGVPTSTGRTLEYAERKGFLRLEGSRGKVSVATGSDL